MFFGSDKRVWPKRTVIPHFPLFNTTSSSSRPSPLPLSPSSLSSSSFVQGNFIIYCMASSLKTTRGIGKRVAAQIWSHPTPPSNHLPLLPVRRVATASVYDKNPEDHNPHTAVPDEVIRPESDKYWAPHPQTGVFGPASGHKTTSLDTEPSKARESSVLEHAAWFRPTSLEDLEKPLQS